jgi:hypothetical protein
MAQTKRKRRTKHRGNAAGMVESRGRTGRRPTPEEQRRAGKQQRQPRMLKPATLQRAAIKAAGLGVLFFLLSQIGFLGRHPTVVGSAVLAAMAMLLYVPAAYASDRWAYNRQQRKLRGG